jgi:integrase
VTYCIPRSGLVLNALCGAPHKAHARRGFYEAFDHAPKEAAWIMIQIGHLYDIERRLRRQRAGQALRDAYRASQSTPVCSRIHRVLHRWYLTRRFLPRSTMGKALSYALGQWKSLEVYLKEPEIEIDNNLVENAIRPTALGKNWLFFGDADAGERSAIIYSIIESCRRHSIELYTYLHDVLTRLPSMTNQYLKATGLGTEPGSPFFPAALGKTGKISRRPLVRTDAADMLKRRLKQAGLPAHYSPHSFRATGITNFLENDGTLEAAQRIAGHADSRTTKLYDRRGQKLLLEDMERIHY